MNKALLSDSLEVLKQLREELHDSVEDSVIDRLDHVIADLETAQSGKSERVIQAHEILLLLGTLIEHVPEIAEIIQNLIKLVESAPGC